MVRVRIHPFILSLALALCFGWQAKGQGATYKWNREEHGFGVVPEEDGPVHTRFFIINTGKNPLHIISAVAGCGCTTPEPSKDPIAPGDSGYVDATFDPKGRPGIIAKNITVTTDGEPASTTLYLKGQVRPKPITRRAFYADSIAVGLRSASTYLYLDAASPAGGSRNGAFRVWNNGKKPITIKQFSPPWVKTKLVPSPLNPGDTGRILLSYFGKLRGDVGPFNDPISLQVNTEKGPKPAKLFVSLFVQEPSKALSVEELEQHGHLNVSPDVLDIGQVNSGAVYTVKTQLSNTGKTPIQIYGIKPNCACIRTELLAKTLLPGAKTELYIHFDAHEYVQDVAKAVVIYSNDLAHPVYSITVKGNFIPIPGQSILQAE